MIPFHNLSTKEKDSLLKFPAYMSLLASASDDCLDETEKKSAIKFSHIKTFLCDPLLTQFYKDADKVFEKNIEQLDKTLPVGKHDRDAAIKDALAELEIIVLKLGKDYVLVMHRSMESFKRHVSEAHHNVFVDFIFPLPIKGLTYN